MLFALVSPLDVVGEEYLFSAHMIQHLLLVLIMPPLLINGITPRFARRLVECPPLGAIERFLRSAVVAWTIGIGMLALWHARDWVHKKDSFGCRRRIRGTHRPDQNPRRHRTSSCAAGHWLVVRFRQCGAGLFYHTGSDRDRVGYTVRGFVGIRLPGFN
jgi:hypothetical protein